MSHLSYLRLAGLAAAALLLIIAALRLRRIRTGRTDVLLLLSGAALLLGVAIDPGLVDAPAEALELRSIRGGRLTTLLIISAAASWALLLWERSKFQALKVKFDRSIRAGAITTFLRDQPPLDSNAIWILVPVLNESENLEALLPKMPKQLSSRPVEVIVIDDGSNDDSCAVAVRHGARVLSLPMNCGGGSALEAGFELATRLGAFVVITMDGDGQHDPEQLADLLAPILEESADLVIGSRVLGEAENASAMRGIGVSVFSKIINLLMSTNITDCSSGFRAVRVDGLRKLTLIQEQYHTAEFIIDAAKRGLRISEVPITISLRLSGESKKGKDLLYGLFFLRTIVKTWLR